jgi:hypothetical protein
LIGGKFDVPLAYGFSVGPLVQIGLSDDEQLYGFSGNLKYTISIPDVPKFYHRLRRVRVFSSLMMIDGGMTIQRHPF